MAKSRGLTAKQARFVTEYLVDLNATQAAIRAGFSARTAEWQGPQLLGKAHVAAAIQAAKAVRAVRVEVTADDIVRELKRIAFGDPRDVMEWGPEGVRLRPSTELNDDQAAAIAEVAETTNLNGGSLKVKKHDKVKALELLARHIGMFEDRIKIDGNSGLTVRIVREAAAQPAEDD